MEKFIEGEVCDLIKELLLREIKKLHAKREWAGVDFTGFEKLSKVYYMTKDDLREDLKAGLFDKFRKVSAA